MNEIIPYVGLVISGGTIFYMLLDILWACRCWLKGWGRDRLDLSERNHLEHKKWLKDNRFRLR